MQMPFHLFDASSPVSAFSIPSEINMAYNMKEIHQGTVLRLFHFFIKNPSAVALDTRLYL